MAEQDSFYVGQTMLTVLDGPAELILGRVIKDGER